MSIDQQFDRIPSSRWKFVVFYQLVFVNMYEDITQVTFSTQIYTTKVTRNYVCVSRKFFTTENMHFGIVSSIVFNTVRSNHLLSDTYKDSLNEVEEKILSIATAHIILVQFCSQYKCFSCLNQLQLYFRNLVTFIQRTMCVTFVHTFKGKQTNIKSK